MIGRRRAAALLALSVGSCVAADAMAHPHVFVTNAIELAMSGPELTEIRFAWTFDDMYSSMMKTDFVKSKGPVLSADDVKSLRRNSFDNLADFNYFVAITVDGVRLPIKRPSAFSARLVDRRMVFDFAVPVGRPIHGGSRVEVSVFDPEYYVEYVYPEAAGYRIVGETALTADCEIVPAQRTPQSLAPVSGEVVACVWRPKD